MVRRGESVKVKNEDEERKDIEGLKWLFRNGDEKRKEMKEIGEIKGGVLRRK